MTDAERGILAKQHSLRRSGPHIRPPMLVAVGLVVLVLLCAITQLSRWPTADVAWQLYLARAVLGGARLGVDFLEVNPPLFVWLSLPAVAVAQLTGTNIWAGYAFLVTGLSVVAAVSFTRSICTHQTRTLHPTAVIGAALTALLVLPGAEFGQREHVALILTLPYIGLRSSAVAFGPNRQESRSTRLLCGVAAGMGFLLKPFFLPAWLLSEALLVGRHGWRVLRTPETMAALGFAALYVGAIGTALPQYLTDTWALRHLYSTYLRQPVWHSFAASPLDVLPLIAMAAVLNESRHRTVPGSFKALALTGIGFWVGAVVQRKALAYHFIAANGYGLILLLLVCAAASDRVRHPSRVSTSAFPAVFLLLLVFLGAVGLRDVIGTRGSRWNAAPGALGSVIMADGPGVPVLFLSSNPASAWPEVLASNAEWASRYVSLWMLAGFYVDYARQTAPASGEVGRQFRPPADRAGVERDFADNVLEDLMKRRPRWIFVLREDRTAWRQWGGATQLDYLAYFRLDPRFQAALSDYDSVGVVDRYSVWCRRESQRCGRLR